MDPPTYERSSENVLVEAAETSLVHGGSHEAPQALLNLVPAQGEVSFQRGYLGYTASTVQGSLQIKFTSSDPAAYRSLVDKVTVEFAGVESINGELLEADDGDGHGHGQTAATGHGKQQQRSRYSSSMQPLDLIRESKTLWDRSSASSARTDSSSSNTSASSSSNLGPPGNLDFTFQLTDDLPHCCHLGSGSIIYSLTATLHSSSAGSLTVQTPIHLTRTSPPPSATSTTSSANAEIYTFQHPTTISVFFPHGTSNFRRSEVIELRVRVPPPDASLVEEKGLRLRSIRAELVRIITVNESGEGEEPEITELIEKPSHRTVISRSGKAAAFSSSRSVFLHIWLQPVDPDSCESITQTTIYNEIEFRIRITASFRGRQGDREEITFFDRPVVLIPDYAPTIESDNNQQLNDALASRRVAVPRTNSGYAASIRDSAASRRSGNLDPELLQAFQNETEYDGYEQMSEGASVETAPPNIDADEPPPSIEEESSGDGHEALPVSDTLQPVQNTLTVPASLVASELVEEAPPYSSASVSLPANTLVDSGLPQSRSVALQEQNEESPAPPPPYERQGGQDDLPQLQEDRIARQIGEALIGVLRT